MASLEYNFRPPKKQKTPPPPLLLLMHGYGSNEHDLFSFAEYLHEDFLVVSVRAPYSLQPMGHAWYAIHFDQEQGKWSDDNQAKASIKHIHRFLDELNDEHPYDKTQIHLLGFSQGGILSYALGLSYPEKFTSIAVLSGYLNENITKLQPISTPPHVFVAHGTLDEVVPFDWGKRSVGLLEENGIKPKVSYEPVGHTLGQKGFQDLLKWHEQLRAYQG
ncbi:MAG: alpha/beta hydrolase [Flavobacteriaceae bacterium]